MRLVVADGTGGKANVPGYSVGGKTGTAEKLIGGRYHRKRLISSFVAAFPMDAPQYVVFAMLDEPKGTKSTQNFATGGWVAAPVVGGVIARMAPVVALRPMPEETQDVAEWKPAAPPRQKPLFISVRKAISDVRRRDIASN